jgi:hypothetical protein
VIALLMEKLKSGLEQLDARVVGDTGVLLSGHSRDVK